MSLMSSVSTVTAYIGFPPPASYHGNVIYVCVCAFRDCPDVRMDEMKPFSVPIWMVEKMQRAMEAQRDADP